MKLKDPIHFFNARGLSVLTQEDQAAKIQELETEIARLSGLLKTAMDRLGQNSEIDKSANPVFH